MKEANILTMASGLVGDEIKFYFHCQLADQSGYGFFEIVFRHCMRPVCRTSCTSVPVPPVEPGVPMLFVGSGLTTVPCPCLVIPSCLPFSPDAPSRQHVHT